MHRTTAPAIDIFTPDIYWPKFKYWVQRYRLPGNAVFNPEAPLETGAYKALYAYGALASLQALLIPAQSEERTRGVVLRAGSPRATQTVALGGYLFQASLSRAWRTNELLASDGGLLLLETQPGECLAVGSGLTVKISRDRDVDDQVAGIGRIEEVTRTDAEWKVTARLKGDQSNQGRQLTMNSRAVRVYRLSLYSAPR